MPEHLRRTLQRVRLRFRILAVADAVILAAAVAGLTLAIGALVTSDPRNAAVASTVMFALVGGLAVAWWRAWTLARVALAIEQQSTRLDNLVVTAEAALGGRAVHPVIAGALFAQATERLRAVDAASIRPPMRLRLVLAALMLASIAALVVQAARGTTPIAWVSLDRPPELPAAASPATLRVTIVPPAYTSRPEVLIENPTLVEALEGSAVRIESTRTAPIEFVARESRVLVVGERLLQVLVRPDEHPVVTIERPGRDLVFGTPSGRIPVLIRARDDLSVRSVALRFTRIAGSGETFTFAEGQIPLERVTATSATSREATATIVLDRLTLEDGDMLVYRAFARDDRPGADPVASESYLVEIGKRGEASSSGFALPDERDRQALSQQMLIMKTERLHAERSKLSVDAVLEQSRMLAVEQRRVRTEFLFMTGGEVADEVEEAEQADDLAQGRYENRGQRELLNAIREMSRAEARLNGAETAQALVFERAALVALERAFDRRRYFLRTLPERTRIDPGRRLSGDVETANPQPWRPKEHQADSVAAQIRDVIAALASARHTRAGFGPVLAARVLALDPRSTDLQQIAQQLSSPSSADDAREAAGAAQQHLIGLLRQRLTPAAPRRMAR